MPAVGSFLKSHNGSLGRSVGSFVVPAAKASLSSVKMGISGPCVQEVRRINGLGFEKLISKK